MSGADARLLHTARSLDHAAAAVRTLARSAAAVAGTTRWQSAAASAAGARMDTALSRLGRTATQLEHAAQLLRSHAVAARRAEAALERAVQIERAAVHGALATVEHVGHAIGRAI